MKSRFSEHLQVCFRLDKNIAYVVEVIYIEAALLLAMASNLNECAQAGRERLN